MIGIMIGILFLSYGISNDDILVSALGAAWIIVSVIGY